MGHPGLTTALLWLCLFACGVPAALAQEPATAPMTEQRLEALLARMTVREKIGQLYVCRINVDGIEDLVRAGEVGGLLNVRDHDLREKLERVAVERSRLGIPLIHGADVIHGYRIQFPIPLGQAAAWNPALVEQASAVAAREATAFGVRWIFAPMIDVARDVRWGRVAEGYGEDPYLTGVLGAAAVRGFQGTNPADGQRVGACPKHFAGYGASEGGRDYNTVDVSERTLRDTHLAPFRACIDAGAVTVMSAFSEVNGVPATASGFLLRQVLRDEWKFDGFVVSDAKAVSQLVVHGLCADEKGAAREALLAGLDVEIISTAYPDHLEALVSEGKVPMRALDDAVRNVLRVKAKLGLFERPYSRQRSEEELLRPDALALARELARQGVVLLKNQDKDDRPVLPLRKEVGPGAPVAVIGPLADAAKDQLGCWAVYGKPADSRTPLGAIREVVGAENVKYAAGLKDPTGTDHSGFDEAVRAAKASSVALLFLGEPAAYTGEAHNRAYLTLPGAQAALYEAVRATGTPVVVVLLSGRPLEIGDLLRSADAVLMAWHPGTMGGPGIADVLFGDHSPAGRLPLSWPRTAGQIPIHYNHQNTGRPSTRPWEPTVNETWKPDTGHVTGYVDLPTSPLFPFGYGLSYTTFAYSDLRVEPVKAKLGAPLRITARVTNTGARAGDEVAQLYVRDLVGSVPRPVKELKGFRRLHLPPGASETVTFTLTADSLAFHNRDMKRTAEPGRFKVWVGGHSQAGEAAGFELE